MAILPQTGLSVSAVRTAIQHSSYDVGTLCKSPNINKWSGHQPSFDYDTYPSNWELGATIPSQGNMRSLIYKTPKTSPYRLGDFRKYNSLAKPATLEKIECSDEKIMKGFGSQSVSVVWYFHCGDIDFSKYMGCDRITFVPILGTSVLISNAQTVLLKNYYNTTINNRGGVAIGSVTNPLVFDLNTNVDAGTIYNLGIEVRIGTASSLSLLTLTDNENIMKLSKQVKVIALRPLNPVHTYTGALETYKDVLNARPTLESLVNEDGVWNNTLTISLNKYHSNYEKALSAFRTGIFIGFSHGINGLASYKISSESPDNAASKVFTYIGSGSSTYPGLANPNPYDITVALT